MSAAARVVCEDVEMWRWRWVIEGFAPNDSYGGAGLAGRGLTDAGRPRRSRPPAAASSAPKPSGRDSTWLCRCCATAVQYCSNTWVGTVPDIDAQCSRRTPAVIRRSQHSAGCCLVARCSPASPRAQDSCCSAKTSVIFDPLCVQSWLHAKAFPRKRNEPSNKHPG